ncbi:MAG: hypothetical protein KJ950_01030 [Proteobacteria bacterium]|nr:hypothetical protein [Pseudomonadota bacterium]MBU1686240.1 hypothetical protein [Pseudomonadota bacterium]
MALMGYDAMNIADGELSLGRNFFAKLSAKAEVPMISANLIGPPGVVPYLIKQVGGLTVAITGITAGTFLPAEDTLKEGDTAGNPVDDLQKILPQLRKQADIVILLSHLGYQGTVNLLQFNDVEGVDVAVAAHGRKLIQSPETINGTTVVQNSLGGEFLGLLRVQISDDHRITEINGEVIALGDTTPEDSRALQMMADFHDQEKDIEKAKRRQLEKDQLNGLDTKYLSMTPQQFVDEVKRKKLEAGTSDPEAPGSFQ